MQKIKNVKINQAIALITIQSPHLITARKRSLVQGNVFIRMCHSVQGGSLYDVTSCLAAWSHVPSGGSLSRGASVQEGGLSGRPPSVR